MSNLAFNYLLICVIGISLFLPNEAFGQKRKKKEALTLQQEYGEYIEPGCKVLKISRTELLQQDSQGKIIYKKYYFDTKELVFKSEYYENAAGEKHGTFHSWTRKGIKSQAGVYQNGKQFGNWVFFDSVGNTRYTRSYFSISCDTLFFEDRNPDQEIAAIGYVLNQKTEFTYRKPTAGVASDSSIVIPETLPEFPGGETALLQFLSRRVQYPAIARELEIQGRQTVQFVIDRDGSICEAKAVSCDGQCFEDELIRLVYTMPKWKPGTQHGKPVKVKYDLPMLFRLED